MSVTTFQWNIPDLKVTCDTKTPIYSTNFALAEEPSMEFALFYEYDKQSYGNVGIVAKNIENTNGLMFSVKIWIEKEKNGVFHTQEVPRYAFDKVGSSWKSDKFGPNAFKTVFSNQKSFTICCEIKRSNDQPPETHQNDLNQKLWELHEDGQFCDAIVQVDDKEFKVISSVFAAQSEIFKLMFACKIEDGSPKKTEIRNASVQAVEAFIKWIYLGRVEDNAILEELYMLAEKYVVEGMRTDCTRLLIKSLDESNAARRLSIAIKYDNKQMKKCIWAYISKLEVEKSLEVMQSEEWSDFLVKRRKVEQ